MISTIVEGHFLWRRNSMIHRANMRPSACSPGSTVKPTATSANQFKFVSASSSTNFLFTDCPAPCHCSKKVCHEWLNTRLAEFISIKILCCPQVTEMGAAPCIGTTPCTQKHSWSAIWNCSSENVHANKSSRVQLIEYQAPQEVKQSIHNLKVSSFQPVSMKERSSNDNDDEEDDNDDWDDKTNQDHTQSLLPCLPTWMHIWSHFLFRAQPPRHIMALPVFGARSCLRRLSVCACAIFLYPCTVPSSEGGETCCDFCIS